MLNTRWKILGLVVALATLGCDSDEGTDTLPDDDAGSSDIDSHSDGETGDSDSSGITGTGIDYKPMTDCAGGVYDPNSNLCWESDPVSLSDYTWEEAMARCETLEAGDKTDWRLPTISELRTFYRPGDNLDCLGVDWSLDWNEPPPGYCRVHDGCTSEDCFTWDSCDLTGFGHCPQAKGPGQHDNCYWDAYISGAVICQFYWSSSLNDDGDKAWAINFRSPLIVSNPLASTINVRCVRTGK